LSLRAWLLLLVVPAVARAEPARPEDPGQRVLGMVATVGFYDGAALGARAGGRHAGLEGSIAYAPVFSTYRTSGLLSTRPFYIHAAQINLSVFVVVWRGARAQVGVTLGYKWNSVLTHGIGAGIYANYELSKSWGARIIGGPVFFPGGARSVRDTSFIPGGGSVSHYSTTIHSGLNFGLVWYP
jgi:hypothetical protein